MTKKKTSKKTTDKPALAIEMWAISRPTPYEKNARKLSDKAVAKCANSIKEFGWQQPIVVDKKGVIIAGHTRLLAAQSLGLAEVPVHVAANLTPAQVRQYRLADNRTAQETSWDLDLLGPELLELQALNLDLSLTGFDADELKLYMLDPTEGLTDPDDCPAPQAEAISAVGDLFILGEHRLLCGDSTSVDAVERLMGEAQAAAVLTDPPYGIDQPGVPGDGAEAHAQLMRDAAAILPITDGVIISFQSTRTFPHWLDAIRESSHKFERMLWLYKAAQCTFPWRGWILKSESILISSLGDPQWQDVHPFAHDCYYLPEVSGELEPGSGWHGSVKPISVATDLLARIAPTKSIVFDGFLGSGTTLMAAEKTGHRCYGLELTPQYCDVVIRRWQSFTGKSATLESDGRTFAELEAERSPKSAAA